MNRRNFFTRTAAVRPSLNGEAWCGTLPPTKTPLLAKNEVTARIKVQ